MPNNKLKIIIAGRAYCRLTGSKLETLYIEADEEHLLRIKVIKKSTTGPDLPTTYDLQPRSKISFTMTDVVTDSAPIGPEHALKRMLQIDNLHDEVLNLKELDFTDSQSTTVSYLSLQPAVCYTYILTESNYEIWKYTNATEKFQFSTQVGNEIGANYLIRDTGNMRITVTNEAGVPAHEIDLPYVENMEYEVRFDNSCVPEVNKPCDDDFHLNYQILEGYGTRIEQRPEGGKTTDAACNPVFGDTKCNLENYFAAGQKCP